MKITEIYIGAFGGLKDFTLNLGDSLNVIYADNEGGKSTVLAFIKAMFYGTGRKGRNELGIREKYTPWDSGAMGGSIVFEHSGRRYRLERQFRQSDSTDHISLCDLDTGLTQPSDKDFAAKLFGIGEAAFERSLFIGVNPHFSDDAEASGEFDLKLSNITQTGEESISLAAVQKRLQGAKAKLISKTGKAGPLAVLKRELEDLQLRHKKSLDDEAAKHQKAQDIKALKGELEALKQTEAHLKAELSRAQDAKNAEKLREYIAVSTKKAELDKELTLADGKALTPSFITAVSFGLQKLTASQNKAEQLVAQAATLKQVCEEFSSVDAAALGQRRIDAEREIEALNRKLNALKAALAKAEQREKALGDENKKSGSALSLVLFILFAVLAAISAVSRFALRNTVLFAVFGAVSLICAISGAVLKAVSAAKQKKAKEQSLSLREEKAQQQTDILNTTAELSAASSRLTSILSLIESGAEEKGKREAALKEKQDEIQQLDAKIQKETDEVLSYFARYKPLASWHEVIEAIEALKQKIDTGKDLQTRLSMLSLDFGELSLEDATERLKLLESGEDSALDTEEMQQQLQKVSQEAAALLQEIVRLETELKAEFAKCENPAAVNKARLMCSSAVESQDRFCRECDTALEVLDEAFREMRKGYGDVLQNKTLEIFSLLTNDRYDAVSVSKSFDIAVRPKGDFISRHADYLSRGTQDQLYLSLRLSLANLLSDPEPLPVFLDDALSQFDDSRTLSALKFLKENMRGTQALLFTCHNAVSLMAEGIGAQVKKI